MSKIEKIRVTKEVDKAIPSAPVIFELCVNAYDFAESQKTDDISCLTAKTKSKIATGTETSGGITINPTEQSMGVILPWIFTETSQAADLATDAWAGGTMYQVGDVVNHSNRTHSLAVIRTKGTGTSGGTEPDITVTGSGSQTITDNDVTWHATPKLVKKRLTFNGEGDKFVLEYDIKDDDNVVFTKRFYGVEASKFPISISGDGGAISFQTELKSSKSETSLDTTWAGKLTDIAGVKVVQLARDYYSGDPKHMIAKIDTMNVCMDKLDVEIDKGLSEKGGTGGCKTIKRDPNITGNFTKSFLTSDYAQYQAQSEFPLTVMLESGMGAYTKFDFVAAKPLPKDPTFETDGEALLEPELSIEENEAGVSVNVEVVYPQFIATDGTVVQW